MSNTAANPQKSKLPLRMKLAWPTQTISFAIGSVLFGYVTYFATNYMYLDPAVVGMLFMVSKIFDGFTDVVAGYLIDRTHSRFGKGRPYSLAMVGYWICVLLLFAGPTLEGQAGYVYLFILYTLINSVFLTLNGCSESVYLANALEDTSQSVSLLSISNLISMVFTLAGSILMPQLIKTVASSREGWAMVTWAIAIPFAAISVIRFLAVKEVRSVSNVEKIEIRDMLRLLGHNKYILLFSMVILVSNIGNYLVSNVGTYYYQYIMGDVGIGSMMNITLLSAVIAIAITPALAKRFGLTNVVRVCTVIGLVGYLLRLVNIHSVPLLFVSNLMSFLGFYPMFSFSNSFVIDCMDYGEWKNKTRSEGSIACAQSVTSKIGTALGTALVGVLMGAAGYQGKLDVQPDAANTMIIILNSLVPAVICLMQLILLHFYDLDKKLPQIREDLKAKAE